MLQGNEKKFEGFMNKFTNCKAEKRGGRRGRGRGTERAKSPGQRESEENMCEAKQTQPEMKS
jgi:hypothetical protein